ncbi:hypothetical protein [Nostoc sp. CCY 9925]|uniref:hypothetical protein n=1 Tax=Nostoc sp. CCY 9925 TaxID=3103865 RepID=UPI0039C61943
MSFTLANFQVGNIIAGKIIKLEPTGVVVDFNKDKLAFVRLIELSFAEIQTQKKPCN